MPTTWVDDESIESEIAKQLGMRDAAGLPSRWDEIITSCNVKAYLFIVRKLRTANYSMTQLNLWAERAEFNMDIAVFFAMYKGGALSDKSDTFIRAMDRRKELDDILLFDESGNPLYPEADVGDEVSFGNFSWVDEPMSPDTTFVMDPTMDPGPNINGRRNNRLS